MITVEHKKRAKIAPPVLAVGQPMVPPAPAMNINEPVVGIGARTGKKHFVLGDNPNGPEEMMVTPPGGAVSKRAKVGGGPTSMATGGYAVIGGPGTPGYTGRDFATLQGQGYDTDQERAFYLSSLRNQGTSIDAGAQQFLDTYPGAGGAPAGGGGSSPIATIAGGDPLAAQDAATRARIASQGAATNAAQSALTAQGNVFTAEGALAAPNQAQLDAERAAAAAQGRVYDAQGGLTAPRQNQLDAQGNVITQQGNQTAAQRAEIQLAQQQNAQRLAEVQGIQAAAKNVPDLQAAAQQRNYNANEDRMYNELGVAAPTEVDLPANYTGATPPGTRAKVNTQEDVLSKEAQNAEQIRSIRLQDAQNIVNLKGTDVDAASQAAARAGLTVDQAQLIVDEQQRLANVAGNTAKMAGFDVNQAQLGVDEAKRQAGIAGLGSSMADLDTERARQQEELAGLPPKPGYVINTDPNTGTSQWVTPAMDAELKAGNLVFYVDQQTGTSKLVTPAEYHVLVREENQTALEQRNGQFLQSSESDLEAALAAFTSTQGKQGISEAKFREILRGRNYSDAEIQAAVESAGRLKGGAPQVNPTNPLGTGGTGP